MNLNDGPEEESLARHAQPGNQQGTSVMDGTQPPTEAQIQPSMSQNHGVQREDTQPPSQEGMEDIEMMWADNVADAAIFVRDYKDPNLPADYNQLPDTRKAVHLEEVIAQFELSVREMKSLVDKLGARYTEYTTRITQMSMRERQATNPAAGLKAFMKYHKCNLVLRELTKLQKEVNNKQIDVMRRLGDVKVSIAEDERAREQEKIQIMRAHNQIMSTPMSRHSELRPNEGPRDQQRLEELYSPELGLGVMENPDTHYRNFSGQLNNMFGGTSRRSQNVVPNGRANEGLHTTPLSSFSQRMHAQTGEDVRGGNRHTNPPIERDGWDDGEERDLIISARGPGGHRSNMQCGGELIDRRQPVLGAVNSANRADPPARTERREVRIVEGDRAGQRGNAQNRQPMVGAVQADQAYDGGNPNLVPPMLFPKIDVEKFSGEIEKWPSFRSYFSETVMPMPWATSVKYRCLVNHLEGEAKQIVADVPGRGDQFQAAWDALKAEYGDQRKLVRYLSSKLQALAITRSFSVSELKAFYLELSTLYRKLGELGEDLSKSESVLAGVEQKLPRHIREQAINLKETWGDCGQEWDMPALMKALKRIINIKEQTRDGERHEEKGNEERGRNRSPHLNSRDSSENRDKRVPTMAFASNEGGYLNRNRSRSPSVTFTCIYCDSSEHPAYKCDVCTTRKEREAKLEEMGRCKECLKPLHGQKCPKPAKCKQRECGGFHPSSLCPSLWGSHSPIRGAQQTRVTGRNAEPLGQIQVCGRNSTHAACEGMSQIPYAPLQLPGWINPLNTGMYSGPHGSLNPPWTYPPIQWGTHHPSPTDERQRIRVGESGRALRHEIHAFSDASEMAFGYIVYIRTTKEDGSIENKLLYAKTKLKPLSSLRRKSLTIPKMELLGALFGVRAIEVVRKAFQHLDTLDKQAFLHCDSSATIARIRDLKKQETYIENRVKEIRKVENLRIRYVPTDDNPADAITRENSLAAIKEYSPYWNAPQWLSLGIAHWPVNKQIAEYDSEQVRAEKKNIEGKALLEFTGVADVTQITTLVNLEKFSKLPPATRKLAYCLRFLKRITTTLSMKGRKWNYLDSFPDAVGNKTPSAVEYEASMKFLIRRTQELFPPSDRQQEQLDTYIGPGKLIRCGGRLKLSHLTNDSRNPILLPRSPLCRLLTMQVHEESKHASVGLTLAMIRRKYWIPQGKKVVREYIGKCMACRWHSAKPYTWPEFPAWPAEKVNPSPPFTHVGLDNFGPLMVRTKHGSEKCWGLLIVCLCTRAIHMELVPDMSSEAFLNAFIRFCSRRAVTPNSVLSDNGKNFIRGQKVVARLWKDKGKERERNIADMQRWERIWKDPKILAFAAQKGIEWRFIAERSPWKGGCYERMVGLVKAHLKRALGRSSLTHDQLHTLLIEIERIVNERPLTFDYSSHREKVPLRPVDLINPLGATEETPLLHEENDDNLPEMLKATGRILRKFWDTWSNDYLMELRSRRGDPHNSKGADIRIPSVGELVIIKEEDTRRGLWKMGTIHELVKSEGGKIRTLIVRKSNGHLVSRGIHHIYRLESNEETKAKLNDSSTREDNEQAENECPVGHYSNLPPEELPAGSLGDAPNLNSDVPIIPPQEIPLKERQQTDSLPPGEVMHLRRGRVVRRAAFANRPPRTRSQ